MNDYLEAGTFMALAAATGNKIRVKGAPLQFLVSPIQKFKEFGVALEIDGRSDVLVFGDEESSAGGRVQTLPYPGFPTDLQAQFGVLATQSKGDSTIFDTLYEGRLKYINELIKMGARAEILDPHRAPNFWSDRTPWSGGPKPGLARRSDVGHSRARS